MEHPNEEQRINQAKFLRNCPHDQHNFHAQMFRTGNAAIHYHREAQRVHQPTQAAAARKTLRVGLLGYRILFGMICIGRVSSNAKRIFRSPFHGGPPRDGTPGHRDGCLDEAASFRRRF